MGEMNPRLTPIEIPQYADVGSFIENFARGNGCPDADQESLLVYGFAKRRLPNIFEEVEIDYRGMYRLEIYTKCCMLPNGRLHPFALSVHDPDKITTPEDLLRFTEEIVPLDELYDSLIGVFV